MTVNYFDWTFDPTLKDVWYLGEPKSASGRIDSWNFQKCSPFRLSDDKLVVAIKEPGAAVDAAFGSFDLLYVSPRMGGALREVSESEIQLVPVFTAAANQQLFLVNVLREIACVDESRSRFSKWEAGNTERPDKAGQYRSFSELHIDPALTQGAHIFRPWGWHVSLIVSERLKDAVESVGTLATRFRLVS
jgi:hypothetical protein